MTDGSGADTPPAADRDRSSRRGADEAGEAPQTSHASQIGAIRHAVTAAAARVDGEVTGVDVRAALELADWRRQVAGLYARIRGVADPVDGHREWVAGRDRLFREHPQSPLPAGDPLRGTGLPVWPYRPELRFVVPIAAVDDHEERDVDLAGDGILRMRRIGRLDLPARAAGSLDVWWLEQYGGGIFVPLRDATAGTTSYGAGRYLLDTAKGADLGVEAGGLVVDLNFLYHPSCRYDPAWTCPLAPAGNRLTGPVEAGERLP